MRTILSESDIIAAYFIEYLDHCTVYKLQEKCKLTTFSPDTLHFKIFRIKKKFANLKNAILNRIEESLKR